MQVKITQKMNQFIYLSNIGGKYFINPIFTSNGEKRQKKAIPLRMAFYDDSVHKRSGSSFF